jgi:hypothetical protein
MRLAPRPRLVESRKDTSFPLWRVVHALRQRRRGIRILKRSCASARPQLVFHLGYYAQKYFLGNRLAAKKIFRVLCNPSGAEAVYPAKVELQFRCSRRSVGSRAVPAGRGRAPAIYPGFAASILLTMTFYAYCAANLFATVCPSYDIASDLGSVACIALDTSPLEPQENRTRRRAAPVSHQLFCFERITLHRKRKHAFSDTTNHRVDELKYRQRCFALQKAS